MDQPEIAPVVRGARALSPRVLWRWRAEAWRNEPAGAMLLDGITRLRQPTALRELGVWGWLGVVYVALAGSDVATTVIPIETGVPVHEAIPFSAWGQSHLGLITFCLLMTVVLLGAVLPVLIGRCRAAVRVDYRIVVLKIVALGAFCFKAAIVANNIVVWIRA